MVAWKYGSLDNRPGLQWTEEESTCLRDWLQQPKQMRLIWHYASRYLGTAATREDVEDAVVEFFTILEQARKSFKPSGITFLNYALCVCFRNYCRRYGQRLQKRQREELPFGHYDEEGEEYLIEFIDETTNTNPVQQAEREAFLNDIAQFLSQRSLSENQKRAFAMRLLEGLSYEEIALRMNVPVGSVKGWVHRATKVARVYMEERGWRE